MQPPKILRVKEELSASPCRWLITGVAGFIGSNLLEELLMLGQEVVGVDNFATGYQRNLDDVQAVVGEKRWSNFKFFEGDINCEEVCRRACEDVDFILHQGALGSVPRSIEDPWRSNEANVSGTLRILIAAKEAKVKKFVYASSSSVYGDSPKLPKTEDEVGRPLSPYAVTKKVNELYADVFASCYGLNSIGLRYFNVFGPRQDPKGAYAAVIPLWIDCLFRGEPCIINGDGQTTRDFCYVANVIQANILAAIADFSAPLHRVYNIALGGQTSLLELHTFLAGNVSEITKKPHLAAIKRDFRKGDIRDSLADISAARSELGYEPLTEVKKGLEYTVQWFNSFRQQFSG